MQKSWCRVSIELNDSCHCQCLYGHIRKGVLQLPFSNRAAGLCSCPLAYRHFAYQNSVYFSRLRWGTTVAIKFSLSCQSDFIYSSVFPLHLFVLLFITYLTLLFIRMGYASTYFNHKRADLSLCRYFLSWLTTCTRIFFPNTWETGFEPGTFAAVLQYLHLDTLVLEQQNAKNVWG